MSAEKAAGILKEAELRAAVTREDRKARQAQARAEVRARVLAKFAAKRQSKAAGIPKPFLRAKPLPVVPRTLQQRIDDNLAALKAHKARMEAKRAANTPEAKEKARLAYKAKRAAMTPAERALEIAVFNAKQARKASRR